MSRMYPKHGSSAGMLLEYSHVFWGQLFLLTTLFNSKKHLSIVITLYAVGQQLTCTSLVLHIPTYSIFLCVIIKINILKFSDNG